MKTNMPLNLFKLSIPAFGDWSPRAGLICDHLWHTITDGAAFDPSDDRLQELEWAYLFASAGMSWSAAHPHGKLFRVSYDLSTGPTILIVLAVPTPDGAGVMFSLHEAPQPQAYWPERTPTIRASTRGQTEPALSLVDA